MSTEAIDHCQRIACDDMNARVAEELRAELARRQIGQSTLAAKIGKTPMWVNLRVRGLRPMSLNDADLMASGVGVTLGDLLRSVQERSPFRGTDKNMDTYYQAFHHKPVPRQRARSHGRLTQRSDMPAVA